MPRPSNPLVRSRLLTVGRDVVHARGFNGCGVQDITAAAGVPKGSFYNYFVSKESFAAEILEAYWQSIVLRHGPILYDARIKPLARIPKFFAGLSQDHRENGYALGCLIGNLAIELSNASNETQAKLAEVLEKWETALAACLQEAQERNEFDRNRKTRDVAKIIIEAYEGAVMRAKVERSGKPCKRFEEDVLPRLLG
jgi:TetR/AcrR family transcriptional regulator, transcriptional repressor for nem operon